MRIPFRPSLVATLLACSALAGGAYAEGVDTQTLPQDSTIIPDVPTDPAITPEPDTADSQADTTVESSIDAADDPVTTGDFTTQLQKLNMDMVQELQSLQLTGDPDVDFATLMLRRVEQDMKLSALEVRRGKSRELRAMALRLYQLQRRERDRLQEWLEQND